MTDQDVIIEIKNWGLAVSIRKDFELNNRNFITSIEFIFGKLKILGMTRVVIDWRLTQRKVSMMNLVAGVDHLKSLIMLPLKYKQAFVVNEPEYILSQQIVEDLASDQSLEIKYFFEPDAAIEWVIS
jgi:hypothetical protein